MITIGDVIFFEKKKFFGFCVEFYSILLKVLLFSLVPLPSPNENEIMIIIIEQETLISEG